MCKYCLTPVADGEETGPEGDAAVEEDAVEVASVIEAGGVEEAGMGAADGSMESGMADGNGGSGTVDGGNGSGAADGNSGGSGSGATDGNRDGAGNWKEKDFEKENAGYAGRNSYVIYGVLAYFGIAVLVPIIFKMNVKFVRFHVNQGLVLFILESLLSVVYGFVGGVPILAMTVSLLRLLCVAFMLFGAISAVLGKEKPLPLVGKIHLIREG